MSRPGSIEDADVPGAARWRVVLPPGEAPPPVGEVAVRLFERGAPAWATPWAEWRFAPPAGPLVAVEVDLRCPDLLGARLLTRDGAAVAVDHACPEPGRLPAAIDLLLSVSTPAGDRVLRRASAEVPRRVQQSSAEAVRLGSAPAIEWFFLELTTACNYACTYCPRPLLTRPQGAMPFDRARAALEMIAAYRRRHPLLQNYAEARHPVFLHVMGEPLLYPRLVELLAHGRGLGLDFALVTNASLLTPEVGAALLDVGVHSVVMSLNAPDARSYAATGAGAPFDEVVRNIQAFVAERARRDAVLPRVEIQLLSSRGAEIAAGPLVETPAQVQEQLAFWSDLVRDVEAEAGAAAPAGREAATWPRALEQPPWDPAHYLPIGRHVWLVVKRACNFANALLPPGRGVRPAGTGRCLFGAPERTFCIFWDGTASFCSLDYDNEVNLGDVFEHGIEALWAGRRMSRIRDLMRRGRLPEALCRRCLGRVVPASAVPRPGRRPT